MIMIIQSYPSLTLSYYFYFIILLDFATRAGTPQQSTLSTFRVGVNRSAPGGNPRLSAERRLLLFAHRVRVESH